MVPASGLPATARCPECGRLVLASAMTAARLVTEDVVGDPSEHPARRPFKFVTETFGCLTDAFLFVRDASRLARGERGKSGVMTWRPDGHTVVRRG